MINDQSPRVVLDTMVLVEAALKPNGFAGGFLRAAAGGVFQAITTYSQIMEVRRTLSRDWVRERGVMPERIEAFVQAFGGIATVRMQGRSEMPLTKDDGDNHIVLAARTTGSIVVTRDEGILEQHPEHLPVMRPQRFAQVLDQWCSERPRYGTVVDGATGKAALVLT